MSAEGQRRYRQRHPDRVKATIRKWKEANREKWAAYRRASGRADKAKNKIKTMARMMVTNAVRAGALTRPERCTRCGLIGTIEAHHPDYSKPLDVRWLCGDCHRNEHRNSKEAQP